MPVARLARRRPLWITVLLDGVLLLVLGLDVWAADFWLRVGGQLGVAVGAVAVLVVLVIVLLLATDARRQWLLGRIPDDEAD